MIAEFTHIIIKYSETSKAQSIAGIPSNITSGSGLYFVLSGTLSCTKASDVSVRRKLKNIIIAAKIDKRYLKLKNPTRNLPIRVFHRSCGNLGSSRTGGGILILITPFEFSDVRKISSSSSTKYSLAAAG